MALRIDDISLNTIIGNGTAISGDIHVNGFVRIDGDVDGNLDTDGNVIISDNARIRGNITAKAVVVGGIIIGSINAVKSVRLMSSSIVIGDILTHELQIDENVIFHGHSISIKNDEKYKSVSEKFLQSKAIKEKVSH
ncbi:MAG: polymer-forming cytoskeletal protein [Treponema sp.]|nr:polymer-forming cytoskeletal protein [Treponema sp.]